MPSEQRLHPASLLFAFARSLKHFALPGLLVLFTARGSSGGPSGNFGRLPAGWEFWLMLLLIPSVLIAIARYVSFRLRYEGTELVIRSGIIFRNERHVPYARIQNLSAVQNLVHRLLGVTEVRVETGAGREPEATISVLPVAAFHEMRRRVLEGRAGVIIPNDAPAIRDVAPPALPGARTLLRLPLRELLLCGFIENRGLVLIAAAYGLLWEVGLLGWLRELVFNDQAYAQGSVRDIARSLLRRDLPDPAQIVVVLLGVAGLLIMVRLVSMAWAVLRLYGFHLTRAGEDLRTEFGLLTRVAATIPRHRVQTLTIRETPLHRLVNRVSVRVATAGGQKPGSGEGATEREWIAPIITTAELPSLVGELMPGFDAGTIDWQPAHPKAFGRAVKPPLVVAIAVAGVLAVNLGWWALATLTLTIPWAILAARTHVTHLGWAANDEVVAFRSGWLWRHVTVANVTKIQAVASIESPFDRHAAMATVRVDTAGASERSHRVAIPYLPRDVAHALRRRLAAQAANTAFRW